MLNVIINIRSNSSFYMTYRNSHSLTYSYSSCLTSFSFTFLSLLLNIFLKAVREPLKEGVALDIQSPKVQFILIIFSFSLNALLHSFICVRTHAHTDTHKYICTLKYVYLLFHMFLILK